MKRKRIRAAAFGLDLAEGGGIPSRKPLKKAMESARVVVAPTPLMSGPTDINAPRSPRPIKLGEVTALLNGGHVFFAGGIGEDAARRIAATGAAALDLLKLDRFAIANAIPTAEGAVYVAIDSMPITLSRCRALVLGAGRVGTALARLLYAFGAKVTVADRNAIDRERVGGMGVDTAELSGVPRTLRRADVVFNTVPSMILDEKALASARRGTLYVELASRPFGLDQEAARAAGLRVVFAPGLPGRFAPLSSAEYMYEAIREVMECRDYRD
jgi:dipicolinate synthase subunit A